MILEMYLRDELVDSPKQS